LALPDSHLAALATSYFREDLADADQSSILAGTPANHLLMRVLTINEHC